MAFPNWRSSNRTRVVSRVPSNTATFTIVLSGIVFAFALSLLGIWHIPVPGLVGAAAGGSLAMLSVDWEGRLYDCDFNQMLGVTVRRGMPQNIREFDAQAIARRLIATGSHCYGCTAGAGSGCRGAIRDGQNQTY